MKPLIDGDILLHEIGWSGEFMDKEKGEEVLLDPDTVFSILDKKIELICEDVEATEPPLIFMTADSKINEILNKQRRFMGEEEKEFVRGFRYDVAKTKPYKGTRVNPKPFHFYNIFLYLLANYETFIAEDGYEADDYLGIFQMKMGEESIICSRDKDLGIIPGWHYSWECGKQKAIGPIKTDELGWLEIKEKKVIRNNKEVLDKKLVGYGLKFFYSQMLTGDTADNIPGLPKWGIVKTYNLLHSLGSHEEVFKATKAAYIETLGKKEAKNFWMEQANLLWMIQKKGENYKLPKFL